MTARSDMAGSLDVRRTSNPEVIRPLLQRDRVRAAYLLGDLDERFAPVTTWYVAAYRGDPVAVVLLYRAGETAVLLSHGAPDGVAAVLEAHGPELPAGCGAKIPLEHRDAYRTGFELGAEVVMWVMGRELDQLPLEPRSTTLRLLDPRDGEALGALYDEHYPEHFFTTARLASEVYVGAFSGRHLVSAAGTHVVSSTMQVAVVGDVVTAEPWRARGYARRCVARLLTELRTRGVRTAALHVEAANVAAISSYRRVGFRFAAVVLQARCRRRPS